MLFFLWPRVGASRPTGSSRGAVTSAIPAEGASDLYAGHLCYCTTSCPTLQKHPCKHLPLVGGGVILRKSRCSSISGLQVFLRRNSVNGGHEFLVCSAQEDGWHFKECCCFFCRGGHLDVSETHLRKKYISRKTAQPATSLGYWTPGRPSQIFQTGVQLCCC